MWLLAVLGTNLLPQLVDFGFLAWLDFFFQFSFSFSKPDLCSYAFLLKIQLNAGVFLWSTRRFPRRLSALLFRRSLGSRKRPNSWLTSNGQREVRSWPLSSDQGQESRLDFLVCCGWTVWKDNAFSYLSLQHASPLSSSSLPTLFCFSFPHTDLLFHFLLQIIFSSSSYLILFILLFFIPILFHPLAYYRH